MRHGSYSEALRKQPTDNNPNDMNKAMVDGKTSHMGPVVETSLVNKGKGLVEAKAAAPTWTPQSTL